jgi:hypothetical protein
MSALDWILTSILVVLYLACLVTVCAFTFQKGYIALGILGIFIPLLWLIGAILPAKPGSPYAAKEAMRLRGAGYPAGQLDQPGPAAGQAGPAAT